jgi:drug/metabolite transporter (DMT)-like permease
MMYLFFVSLLWAFSFGLIKTSLGGQPMIAMATIRLLLSMAVFAPFLRLRGLRPADTAKLMLTGAAQYGLMYITYFSAFNYLKASEVVLFTVFTPIYVTLINDLFKRRFNPISFGAVLLAVVGGAIITYQNLDSSALWTGFALMQIANLCFAFGQVFYRRIMATLPEKKTDLQVFGLLYLGATFAAALAATGTDWSSLTLSPSQANTLLYLGIIPSGLCFFLWNLSARKTSAGTLAVFNNLKIPLGILVSVFLFKEQTDWVRLAAGGTLMVIALLLNARKSK